jgi:hypothetical protein
MVGYGVSSRIQIRQTALKVELQRLHLLRPSLSGMSRQVRIGGMA